MKKFLIGLGVLIVVLVAAFFAIQAYLNSERQGVVPEAEPLAGWARMTTSQGIEFMYPESLQTTYISAQEWPPRIEEVAHEYSCTEGTITATDGPLTRVERKAINGREYCVGVSSEGAAGSTYRTYEYTTVVDDSTVRLVLTLRFPQCLNYDDPNQSACGTEQERFNLDSIVDRIIETVRLP